MLAASRKELLLARLRPDYERIASGRGIALEVAVADGLTWLRLAVKNQPELDRL